MKGFIDTSSLFKKYCNEEGDNAFDTILETLSEIIVSPITWLEINSVLARRIKEKTLNQDQADWILREAKKDFIFFSTVLWNETLEKKGTFLINKYQMKTLDSIQLASGILAEADIFLTSDKQLFNFAKEELKVARFV